MSFRMTDDINATEPEKAIAADCSQSCEEFVYNVLWRKMDLSFERTKKDVLSASKTTPIHGKPFSWSIGQIYFVSFEIETYGIFFPCSLCPI